MIAMKDGFDPGAPGRETRGGKYSFAFISLMICILIIYGNSFQGTWQFDDFPHIVDNPNIRARTLSFSELRRAVDSTSEHRLPRPVPYLSFAVNYFFGGLHPFGYHLVNIAAHILTAWFLFLLLYTTLNLPLLRDRCGAVSYPVALLATFFWATSPVQVNAVTYIVQRMTGLVGLFSVAAIYFFVRGRMVQSSRARGVFLALCTLSAVLAFATKENAAMLPVSIALYDLLLIRGASRENLKKNLLLFALPFVILLILGAIYFAVWGNMRTINYANWTFTLTQRLLTETRVIIFYGTLLLYPISSRLTMDHDIAVSTSLVEPLSTLPAVLGIGLLTVAAFMAAGRRPLWSFCILFFLLNHAIEGSIIPLDLIFEHRNYLPSMFFFVPVAFLMVGVLDFFAYRKSIQMVMAFGIVFLLAAQGHTVTVRNGLFASQTAFWQDNVEKYPLLSRPHAALGKLFVETGQKEKALSEFELAVALDRYPNKLQPAIYRCNLGSYYLHMEKDGKRARAYYDQALRLQPQLPDAHHGMAMVELKRGDLAAAHASSVRAITAEPKNASFHSFFSLILLKEGRYSLAIRAANEALLLNENLPFPLTVIAETLRRRGQFETSVAYWERYLAREPDNMDARLALVELYNRQGKQDDLIRTVGQILSLKGTRSLRDLMHEESLVYIPSEKVLMPIMTGVLRRLADQKP